MKKPKPIVTVDGGVATVVRGDVELIDYDVLKEGDRHEAADHYDRLSQDAKRQVVADLPDIAHELGCFIHLREGATLKGKLKGAFTVTSSRACLWVHRRKQSDESIWVVDWIEFWEKFKNAKLKLA